jgi:RNA polymerase sigma-70 factor, ECF subfamily
VTFWGTTLSILVTMQPERTISLQNAQDSTLVLLATLGSLPAFDELIRRYRNPIIVAASQIVGCRSVAEDVAQETFIKAFQALPSLEDPQKFPFWLRAIARNFALKTLQGRKPTTTWDETEEAIIALSREIRKPEDDWIAKIERAAVLEALNKLPPDYQEVLYLAAYEDWSLAQIAEYLSLTEDTIRGRLYRARQTLRKNLTYITNLGEL